MPHGVLAGIDDKIVTHDFARFMDGATVQRTLEAGLGIAAWI